MVTSATRKLSLCVADVTINSASYSPMSLTIFSYSGGTEHAKNLFVFTKKNYDQ